MISEKKRNEMGRFFILSNVKFSPTQYIPPPAPTENQISNLVSYRYRSYRYLGYRSVLLPQTYRDIRNKRSTLRPPHHPTPTTQPPPPAPA
jgi:hypothetical protein